ncbi:MAG: ABC transporter substrate-binding protein [Chloroflexota bacterium]|nr:ABC transporter substrate-binding protein [Chloroflexota bacterium]
MFNLPWRLVINRVSVPLLIVGVLSGGAVASAHSPAKTSHKQYSGILEYSDWEFPGNLNEYTAGGNSTLLADELIGPFGANQNFLYYDNRNHLHAGWFIKQVPSVKNGLVTNGGRTIRFNIKPGMRWSNGQEITNKDYIFGWKVENDPATGPACLGTCDAIASITAVGKYGFVYHMKHIYSVLPNLAIWALPHNWSRLGNGNVAQAAKTIATDTSYTYEDSSYVTAGPYQVQSYVSNDRIVFTPMKYWRGPGGPYLKEVIFVFYANKPAMIAAAASGQTNITQDYTLADYGQLLAGAHAYKIQNVPSFTVEQLAFNVYSKTFNGQPNPLTNLKVRQALALSIDKVGMVRSALGVSKSVAANSVVYGPLVVTKALVQPFGDKSLTGSWDPIAKKYLAYSSRAVADAKKLLDEAGFSHGFTLQFYTTSGNPVRQAQYGVIARNWSALGVTAVFNTVPASQLFTDWVHSGTLARGAFQVGMFAYEGAPDPDGLKVYIGGKFVPEISHAAVDANDSGFQDKVIDHALTVEAGSFNKAVRTAAWKAIQVEMNKQAYWVPLFARPAIATVNSHAQNVSETSVLPGITWNVNNWRYRS